MRNATVGCLLAASFLFSATAFARPSPIAKALGNVRWGMDSLALKSALKGKLDKEASPVEFDGRAMRWDSSSIGEEYTHGNEESMFVVKSGESEDYFFLIGGELWKWVKVFPASSFGGRDFNRFASKIQGRFGKGYKKEGEVNPGSGQRYTFIEYLDRSTRLRAIDRTAAHGEYALVFESMETVRALSALRGNTIRRGGPKQSVASKRPERESEPVASTSAGAVNSAKSRASIFSDERQDENAGEYAARKKRVLAERRDQQRRVHARGEESKKGKTLDELAGVDDDDPLAGMR